MVVACMETRVRSANEVAAIACFLSGTNQPNGPCIVDEESRERVKAKVQHDPPISGPR